VAYPWTRERAEGAAAVIALTFLDVAGAIITGLIFAYALYLIDPPRPARLRKAARAASSPSRAAIDAARDWMQTHPDAAEPELYADWAIESCALNDGQLPGRDELILSFAALVAAVQERR
jgi:hypothetical protein